MLNTILLFNESSVSYQSMCSVLNFQKFSFMFVCSMDIFSAGLHTYERDGLKKFSSPCLINKSTSVHSVAVSLLLEA